MERASVEMFLCQQQHGEWKRDRMSPSHGQKIPTSHFYDLQEVPDKRGASSLQGVLGQLARWQLLAAQ